MEFKTGKSNSQNLLKLKAGESVKGVFRGDPYEFKQHWEGGKPTLCLGLGMCPKCETGENKALFRFHINIIVKENGESVAKVWEQGWTVFLALKALHEGGYDLEKYLMKISRTGSTKNDTVYSIVPVPNGLLSPVQLKELDSVKLIDLATGEKKEELKPSKGRPVEPLEDEVPF